MTVRMTHMVLKTLPLLLLTSHLLASSSGHDENEHGSFSEKSLDADDDDDDDVKSFPTRFRTCSQGPNLAILVGGREMEPPTLTWPHS